MFSNTRKTKLFDTPTKRGEESNTMVATQPFVRAGLKNTAKTIALGNGAVKFTTTGNDFVDQFGKVTSYREPRNYSAVDTDMKRLWSQNPMLTVALLIYIRMITRVVQFFYGESTTTTQRGQGLKHEGLMRLIWLHLNAPETFWKNVTLFIAIGSWNDIFNMLKYDLMYNGWEGRKLDWDKFGAVILAGLENENSVNLVKKYLPQIRTRSKCKTLEAQADNIIGKWIVSTVLKLGEGAPAYQKYRQLKSSGTAHTWQQLISRGKLLQIDFSKIHGRALAQLVGSKFLANNNLTAEYQKWIESQPVAKYTGFVYELFAALGSNNNMDYSHLKPYQVDTMNKQFYGLIETAKKGMKDSDGGLIVVVDSSGSMMSAVPGTKASAYSVAKTMALYFSYLLKGKFEGTYLEFSEATVMKQWTGSTPVQQLCNDKSTKTQSTNFLSVADHFGKILKSGVAESDFPTGILCISDGCFNSAGREKTNVVALKQRLAAYGFSKEFVANFKVVLWDVPNNNYGKPQTAFEDFADCPNLFHVSGLDGAAIAFLTGTEHQVSTPKNSEELFLAAMNQEVMGKIQL